MTSSGLSARARIKAVEDFGQSRPSPLDCRATHVGFHPCRSDTIGTSVTTVFSVGVWPETSPTLMNEKTCSTVRCHSQPVARLLCTLLISSSTLTSTWVRRLMANRVMTEPPYQSEGDRDKGKVGIPAKSYTSAGALQPVCSYGSVLSRRCLEGRPSVNRV